MGSANMRISWHNPTLWQPNSELHIASALIIVECAGVVWACPSQHNQSSLSGLPMSAEYSRSSLQWFTKAHLPQVHLPMCVSDSTITFYFLGKDKVKTWKFALRIEAKLVSPVKHHLSLRWGLGQQIHPAPKLSPNEWPRKPAATNTWGLGELS